MEEPAHDWSIKGAIRRDEPIARGTRAIVCIVVDCRRKHGDSRAVINLCGGSSEDVSNAEKTGGEIMDPIDKMDNDEPSGPGCLDSDFLRKPQLRMLNEKCCSVSALSNSLASEG